MKWQLTVLAALSTLALAAPQNRVGGFGGQGNGVQPGGQGGFAGQANGGQAGAQNQGQGNQGAQGAQGGQNQGDNTGDAAAAAAADAAAAAAADAAAAAAAPLVNPDAANDRANDGVTGVEAAAKVDAAVLLANEGVGGAVDSGPDFEAAVQAIVAKGNQDDITTLKAAGIDVDTIVNGAQGKGNKNNDANAAANSAAKNGANKNNGASNN